MQTKNLSSAQTFGTAIVSLPDDMPCTSHCCVRAGEPIKEWLSQEPVVLDYVSGMPLLVIYEAESYSLYYLDRVFKLRPGVRFSVAALDDLCGRVGRLRMRHDLLERHRADLNDLMAFFAQRVHNGLLQPEAALVAANYNFHNVKISFFSPHVRQITIPIRPIYALVL